MLSPSIFTLHLVDHLARQESADAIAKHFHCRPAARAAIAFAPPPHHVIST
jgi:hypothetical protein